MSRKRPGLPKRIEKALYQEVGSSCPLCGESDIVKLTVHHIEPWAECQEHDPLKMIVLCANCHARASAGDINGASLYRAKLRARATNSAPAAAVVQHVVGDRNAVAGRDVNIRVTGRSRRSAFPRPAGTVCDDPRKVGYLQYLAKRYNQFKEWDVGNRGNARRSRTGASCLFLAIRGMKERDYRMIPVSQINVVNSRQRDRTQFLENVRSINDVGLYERAAVCLSVGHRRPNSHGLCVGRRSKVLS